MVQGHREKEEPTRMTCPRDEGSQRDQIKIQYIEFYASVGDCNTKTIASFCLALPHKLYLTNTANDFFDM